MAEARDGPVALGRGGTLRVRDRSGGEAVAAVLGGAGGRRDAVTAGGSHRIHALPLDPETASLVAHCLFGDVTRAAALVLVEPLGGTVNVVGRLAALGLSRAEAEVALALCDVGSPGAVAEARGASVHTVRNQLKSTMAKLGLQRQAELAALVERVRAGR